MIINMDPVFTSKSMQTNLIESVFTIIGVYAEKKREKNGN